MGLINRLSTLVKADAHGVVDAIEDHSLLLRQHVREAEMELNRKRARLGALQAEQKSLEEESRRARDKMAGLEQDISLAMKEGEEDLARFAIKKQLPLRRCCSNMEDRLEEISKEQELLVETLTQQETEFESLRARVRIYLAQAGSQEGIVDPFQEPFVEDEEIDIELLRRRQSVERGG